MNTTTTAPAAELTISGSSGPLAILPLPGGHHSSIVWSETDEAARAMSVMEISPDGSLVENAANDVKITRAFGRKLSDLEGLSVDDEGHLYTITSHSRTNDG